MKLNLIVVILIYTPYIYAYNDRYIRITLLEYYYIIIIVAIGAVIFILDVLYLCDSTRYYKRYKVVVAVSFQFFRFWNENITLFNGF